MLESIQCKIDVHDLMTLWIIFQSKISNENQAGSKYKSYIESLPKISGHPLAVKSIGWLLL